ncbi:MAG TPA: hypothetical protein VG817_12560 [Gemmatimonadales bacterium]|nr:hypothetical protein [Gemmatimonadales bacterium]
MRRRLAALLLLSLVVAPRLAAQQAGGETEKEVLAALDRFFEGMTGRDTVLSRAVMLPGARFYVPLEGRTRIQSDTAYIASLTKGTSRLVERIRNPTVLIRGDLAEVWTWYEFLIDDKRSHCGVDSFTFLRTESGWRMATAAYTIETTGCPE